MSLVSRRAALQSLGALGLGAALPASAVAAPRPARRDHHVVSTHTFSVGEALVTVIRDTGFPIPLSAIGTNVDDEAVVALMEEFGLPTETAPTDVSQLVIDTGGVRVVLDTGTGQGNLIPAMQKLGLGEETVDRVVISHFHGDHVGGVSDGVVPTFPNASVHFPEPELAFLESFEGENQGVTDALDALSPVRNVLETYDDGDELAPGLTAVAAHGHTPGHMVFVLESGDARLMIASDAVAHPVAFFRYPEWLFGFDMAGDETVATRRRLLDRAVDEKLPFFASHMPFPGVGRVSRDGGGFRYTPAPML
ncbi:MBL fold metallo-hydrolase [Rubrivirga sp.]|uniref:MBL fold metallo-hydrolase n=1 Tax=Rubrivirga sp. TaxID=1885344 RepID=UPI003C755E88